MEIKVEDYVVVMINVVEHLINKDFIIGKEMLVVKVVNNVVNINYLIEIIKEIVKEINNVRIVLIIMEDVMEVKHLDEMFIIVANKNKVIFIVSHV